MSLWYSMVEVNNMEESQEVKKFLHPHGVCMNSGRLLSYDCVDCQFAKEADCEKTKKKHLKKNKKSQTK